MAFIIIAITVCILWHSFDAFCSALGCNGKQARQMKQRSKKFSHIQPR